MMLVDEDGWKSVEILFDLIVNMVIIISINILQIFTHDII